MFRFVKLILGVVLLAATGRAAVVNLDFQHREGPASTNVGTVLPSPGTYWNTNRPGSGSIPTLLLTSTGAPTGLELVTSFDRAPYLPDGSGVYNEYVLGDATIRGLTVGKEYHIVIYGAANVQDIFRVEQPFVSFSPGYGEVDCTFGPTAMPGLEGCDWIEGLVTADAAGEINVRVSPGAMSGMQLALNPEPSVLLLNAIAGLGAALRRRRSD